MNESQRIDGAIRSLLDGRDDTANARRGRALAARRLDEVIDERTPRARRRRIARPRLAITLACGFVLVSGVAVAATTDLAQRILESKEPAAERIRAVRRDPRPDMTQNELVAAFRRSFENRHGSERGQAELGPTLVGDDRARLSARRTAEGGVCIALERRMMRPPGTPEEWHLDVTACGTFEEGWPIWGVINSGSTKHADPVWYGLVADGVKQVRFIVDGTTFNAKMGVGSYMWRNPSRSRPSDEEAVLDDGTVVRRDISWSYHGPGKPSKPYIVSGRTRS